MDFKKIISRMGFLIHLEKQILHSKDIKLKSEREGNSTVFTGMKDGISIRWIFTPCALGFLVQLELKSDKPIGCKQMDSFYRVDCKNNMADWAVPMFGNRVEHSGIKTVSDLHDEGFACRATGVFEDLSKKGAMVAQVIPLKFIFNSRAAKTDDKLVFSAETVLTPAYSSAKKVSSQLAWFCEDCTPREGMDFLRSMLPKSTITKPKSVGWNSWDYYFSTVSHDDIMENVNFIAGDSELAGEIKYIAIDDGWQHNWGEWVPNYKFAKGMKYTADEIAKKGFIPGIWTSPVHANPLSYPALRTPDMLVPDSYGDPKPCREGGDFMIDPTHPRGREFIYNLFKGLYNDGFRLFKVDYVSSLLKAEYFYDKTAGPYDAIIELFKIIRDAVTFESIVIGCSLPVECGADHAESARIAIDIHNCWPHVEWVIDSLQYAYQYQNTIWRNDLDFIVVRGGDTSVERETNVLNPIKNYQAAHKYDGTHLGRWRNGDDFNYYEAETWANFVALSGGNIFLSDRLTKLNHRGMSLIKEALRYKKEEGMVPTFLKGDVRATLWTSCDTVMIVNWNDYDDTKVISIDLDGFDIRSKKQFTYKDKQLAVMLKAHESIVLELNWQNY